MTHLTLKSVLVGTGAALVLSSALPAPAFATPNVAAGCNSTTPSGGTEATQCGVGADASGSNSTAVGENAEASGSGSTAVGQDTNAIRN